MNESPPPEVRPYLIRLVALILFGVALMASVATWAWSTYGEKLEQRAPLPSGPPPLTPGGPARPPESR